MANDLLYYIALTGVPQIGDVQMRELLQHFDSAKDIFLAKKNHLEKIPGIGSIRAHNIKAFKDFSRAEEELTFTEKYKIHVLVPGNINYPRRLLNCYDAPSVLYYKGGADLNMDKVVSVIGSRTHTDYGREMTNRIIEELSEYRVLVVSGLAYGIDAIAHKTALKNELPTIGVLAHGLDRIYPSAHSSLAKEMIRDGGILSDFMSGTKPDKQNFPKRNRIVAGIADATIVIETSLQGGSMITAELAGNYNKDVFAVPGRANDIKSAGCNYLISSNKAALITSGKDIIECMNWDTRVLPKKKIRQTVLFSELTPEQSAITEILSKKDAVHIDEINLSCDFSSSIIAAAILDLELQGLITSLPGKLYKLN
ncbi:MAG: DNA-processing protein DprA [Terrimonas sp.]|nr:DNA-processing protein DprA [Terrimonas sp.]OJY82506.1 MAG: DNA protecting protein DprA [Sphingobacteriales bacterium 40-81]